MFDNFNLIEWCHFDGFLDLVKFLIDSNVEH